MRSASAPGVVDVDAGDEVEADNEGEEEARLGEEDAEDNAGDEGDVCELSKSAEVPSFFVGAGRRSTFLFRL
jgi:hypothetical protein